MKDGWFLFLTYGEWGVALIVTMLYFIVGNVIFKYTIKKICKYTLYVFAMSIAVLLLSNIAATYFSKK